MKILTQFSLLFTLCAAGNAVSSVLPVTLPGSVIAMLVLLVLLCTKIIKPANLEPAGDWVLNNMAFFFLPPSVGIMEYFDVLSHYALQLVCIVVVSTVVTFAVATWAGEGTLALQKRLSKSK